MSGPAVLGIYGESNTGKTMLIVKIIKTLSLENFKVASVKITNKDIGVDTKGKDTWKHGEAGADLVVFSSNSETAYLSKNKTSIEKIIQNIDALGNYDVVLVEGANDEKIPKIRIGKISKRTNTVFTFDDNFNEIIKFIKNEIFGRKNMQKTIIKVNGKKIPLSEFPEEFIKNSVCGMLKTLKGVDEIKNVEMSFEV